VDEAAGHYELDCSGLACYALQRVLPRHYQALQAMARAPRLTARMFQGVFAGLPTRPEGKNGWRQIARAADARPGDIIAWKSASPKPGSTGHVVLCDGVPSVTPQGLVRLPIIDSTSRQRWDTPEAKGQTGLGRRALYLAVDAEGRPTAYSFSPASKLTEHPISIGRAVAFPAGYQPPAPAYKPVSTALTAAKKPARSAADKNPIAQKRSAERIP